MRTNRMLWYIALPILVLVACVLNSAPAVAQMTSTGIDCSQIAALHLLQQDNMRAGLALMECGVIPRPDAAGLGDEVVGDQAAPPNIIVSNRSCSSGSSCTKSESNVGHTRVVVAIVVVVINDDGVVTRFGTVPHIAFALRTTAARGAATVADNNVGGRRLVATNLIA